MGGKKPMGEGRGGEGTGDRQTQNTPRIPGGAHVQNYVSIVCLSHVGTLVHRIFGGGVDRKGNILIHTY